jgi:hypothetical protein
MGKYDSSKTRVVPVFDALVQVDATGGEWLGRLLQLPTGGTAFQPPASWDLEIQDRGWGDAEKKLEPPVALLSWLIRNPRRSPSGELSSDPVKAQKRRELMAGSRSRTLEGLALLRENPRGEDWHIFEGPSQPDVFIETPSVLVVIEGKRTEPKPTTSTKWMAGRHQMLRHIDCAWEVRGQKQVVGFFVVEGDGGGEEVPQQWVEYARETTAAASVASSLPHRGPEEQRQIASCFIGVTTWQKICREFGIDIGE